MSPSDRNALTRRLLARQGGLCYICDREINLKLDTVDIDHIIPISRPFNGLDDEQNWGLVHRKENESKSNRSLQLIRYIYQYRALRDDYVSKKGDFTVGDALEKLQPSRMEVSASIDDSQIEVSYVGIDGISVKERFGLLSDSGMSSFVGMVPFRLLYHDKNVNPRSIVDLEPMIEEFYNKRPQLQPSLAHLRPADDGMSRIMLFDGQHKAAAQLFNNKERLFTRVFVNASIGLLKDTNFRAHTVLAQIHFPDMVEDKVGHDLFKEAFDVYLSNTPTNEGSELAFIQSLEDGADYRQHLQRFVRYEVLFNAGQQHRLLSYVETVWARSKKYPLVYDTLNKSFFRFFLCQSPTADKLADSQKYRRLERENLAKLMTIFAEEVLDGRFELGTGIYKLEEKLEENPNSVKINHLAAYRMCRAAPMVIWANELQKAIVLLLKSHPGFFKNEWAEERPLWVEIPEEQWNRVRRMVRAIRDHEIWIERTNKDVINEITSTRQKDWKEMLLDGRLPGRTERLLPPLTYTKIHELSIG